MGIVSETSRHHKDVFSANEFWWATYGLGAITPRKEQTSAKFHISNLQNYKFQRHSPGGDTLYYVPRYALCCWLQELEASSIVQWVHVSTSLARGHFEPVLQWVHRHTATCLVSFKFGVTCSSFRWVISLLKQCRWNNCGNLKKTSKIQLRHFRHKTKCIIAAAEVPFFSKIRRISELWVLFMHLYLSLQVQRKRAAMTAGRRRLLTEDPSMSPRCGRRVSHGTTAAHWW